MLSLVELTTYRLELIEVINKLRDVSDTNNKISLLKNLHVNNPSIHRNEIDIAANQYETLNTFNNNIIQNIIIKLLDEIESDIAAIAKNYNIDISSPDRKYIKFYDSIVFDNIISKIQNYSSWLYPGLLLGSYHNEWINAMVSSDPLYLVGDNFYTLTSVYTSQYQQRLRMYTFDQFDSLPPNQFGLISSWDYFNFTSIEKFEFLLEKCIRLLRPGGTLIFSYNDGDIPQIARLIQDGFLSYNTNRNVTQLCLKYGYEITNFSTVETNDVVFPFLSWAEIKKPGTLDTIKLHPSLGKII